MASDTQSLWSTRVSRRAASAAILSSAIIAVGSLFYRTRRESTTTSIRSGRVISGSAIVEGFGGWAPRALYLGLTATILLLGARCVAVSEQQLSAWRRNIAVAFVTIAAACAALGSFIALQSWVPLLVERAEGPTIVTTYKQVITDGAIFIAWGLPIVTFAGAIGTIFCLIFAVALHQSRSATDHTAET